jgi:glycosyltransferase involved in cell wall biosynthesis
VDLYKYTPSADIGLCLLDDMGLSYRYALPNRIFDYLHAGVPVLATHFPEIEKIVSTYKTGVLINHYESEYLAKTINELLQQGFDTSHFADLSDELCWENESKKLIEIIQKLDKN